MATLEEVLSNMSDEDYLHDIQFVIDEDLRTITIPNNGIIAGVVGDKDINRINFVMPRYYNGFDMRNFEINVYYSNANNEVNYYIVNDVTIEKNCMLFSWLIDSAVTAYAGKVKFLVRMIKNNGSSIERSFNTTTATLNVLEGFGEFNGYTPEEKDYILDRITELDRNLTALTVTSDDKGKVTVKFG